MTPKEKTKLKDGAQVRSMVLMPRSADAEGEKLIDTPYYVEGYAARYEPYVLWEDEDGPVYEHFAPEAFAGCDMGDVIFQYDHAGRVFARTSNGTLVLRLDDKGLFIAADLQKTSSSKSIYEDIAAGLVTKMSWRFVVDDEYYDAETRTIEVRHVKKIYDVSAVSIPANENTEISARAFVDGEIAKAARREAEKALMIRRERLKLKIKTNF